MQTGLKLQVKITAVYECLIQDLRRGDDSKILLRCNRGQWSEAGDLPDGDIQSRGFARR